MGGIIKGLNYTSIVAVLLAVVYAIVGGVVVIWGHPGALSFQDYGNQLRDFVIALGILGGGQAVAKGIEQHGALTAGLTSQKMLADFDESRARRPRARSGTTKRGAAKG